MNTFTTSDGVRIAYRIDDFTDPWKTAPTLVMLHAAMASTRRLYSMVPGFARHYRVVRLDTRGHGESQIPPAGVPLDKERLTQDVLEALDHLGLDRVHLLGTAGGGFPAQQIAIHHPHRVKSLMLFGSPPGFKGEQGKRWLKDAAVRGLRPVFADTIADRFPAAKVDPRFAGWFVDEIARNDLDWLTRYLGYWTDTEFMAELDAIRCPTLIVAPGAESIGSGAVYPEMARRIPGSELVVYEGESHNIFDYLPDRCVADGLRFLSKHFPHESGIAAPSATPAARMHSFTASDGLEIRYAVDDYTDPWKPTQTLFLLHAAMGSSRRLYRWVPILARHFRVVRPDMRGHGQSGVPGADQLTLSRLARDVDELAQHLDCERIHLAGSSAGAIVAMQTAIEYPSRIRTLANFASTPGLKNSLIEPQKWIATIRSKGLRAFMQETIHDRFPGNADPEFLRWFVDESARTDEDLLCRFVPMMKEVDQTSRLKEIACPMLTVVPDHDPLGTLAQYEVIRDLVRDCEFVVYSGLPHNITDAVPERCAEELKRFLLEHALPE